MIVVADTTPLNYLVLIGEIEVLSALHKKILIPSEVHRELQHPQTPPAVRAWGSSLPHWCEVLEPVSTSDPVLNELDAGERDAILLTLEQGLDTLLIDESKGRWEAMRRHLKVAGTIGILEKASQRGLIDFHSALQRLEQTNFRLSAKLRNAFVNRNN
jgi:predicted nucleic acid-binding protein